MEISGKQYNPGFRGIRVQTSAMNTLQRNAANNTADALGYLDEYCKAADWGVDVIFHVIDGVKNKIKVSYLDTDSEMFYKFKTSGNPVFNVFSTDDTRMSVLDKICRTLKKITANKFQAEDFDYEKIFKGETDLAKLDPRVKMKTADIIGNLGDEADNTAEFSINLSKEYNRRLRKIGIHKNEEF